MDTSVQRGVEYDQELKLLIIFVVADFDRLLMSCDSCCAYELFKMF